MIGELNMATASEEDRLYARSLGVGRMRATTKKNRQAHPLTRALAELALHWPEAQIAAKWSPEAWVSRCHRILPIVGIAVGFALTAAWTVLLVFELLRAVDVTF